MKSDTASPLTNAVEEVVYSIFDGPSDAAAKLGVTRQALYVWLGRRLIWNRETALAVEAATAQAKYAVPAAELMALVPWEGPGPRNGARATSANTLAVGAKRETGAGDEPAGATAQLTRRARRRGASSTGRAGYFCGFSRPVLRSRLVLSGARAANA